ncbi:hypothetical protein [Otariodibacter sp.]|uniref:tetratricopeptide repeat protein n=1 Tax=Otariodibacter sp. TaxID=3030919 RepID=UPI002626A6D8|nr:hypothetical protein [Otariodibacter sp.]
MNKNQLNKLFKEGKKLFDDGKYDDSIEKLNLFLKQFNEIDSEEIASKASFIQQKINAQFWLGRCYLEKGNKEPDSQKAQSHYDTSITHHKQQLVLAKVLIDYKEEKGLEEQIYAESWLGGCYLEKGNKEPDNQKAQSYYDTSITHNKQRLDLAKNLTRYNEEKGLEKQLNAKSLLGHCYLEKGNKEPDNQKAQSYYDISIIHYEQQLALAKTLTNYGEENALKEKALKKQLNAQFRLGHCYLAKGENQKNSNNFDKSIKYFNFTLKLIKEVGGDYLKKYNYVKYFQLQSYWRKLSLINNRLLLAKFYIKKTQLVFSMIDGINNINLKKSISRIQSLLLISPIEIDNIAFSHYTTPSVCELLLGIKRVSKDIGSTAMRMNSSSYMNDPLEGKSLLEFLNQQELQIENKIDVKAHNAFFTCFSNRVNDLNQFRLYGKVDNVEASGCCLVFSKDKLVKYEYTNPIKLEINQDNTIKQDNQDNIDKKSNKLPLYQVAYIFYKDEYIKRDEYDIFKDKNKKFGIYLKPVSSNTIWEEFRRENLATELDNLRKILDEENLSEGEKLNALEYIRYLFKDYAFRDEEEFRLLRIEPIDSEDVKYCLDTNSLYLEYGFIGDMVDEVILGTNYEYTSQKYKTEVFKHLLHKQYLHIKVSHSSLPISHP